MTAEIPDEEYGKLLRHIRAGDHAALDALVRTFWEPVMRFCWTRVSTEDAEDLAQEVFVAVYRAIREGRGPRDGRAADWRRYLFSCARNRVIDYWRRKGAKPPTRGLEDLLDRERSTRHLGSGGHKSDGGAGALISQERRQAIRDCLGRLDVRLRAMSWLVFVENTSRREIGRMLGEPESSVRAALAEALRTMRECLEGKGMAPA